MLETWHHCKWNAHSRESRSTQGVKCQHKCLYEIWSSHGSEDVDVGLWRNILPPPSRLPEDGGSMVCSSETLVSTSEFTWCYHPEDQQWQIVCFSDSFVLAAQVALGSALTIAFLALATLFWKTCPRWVHNDLLMQCVLWERLFIILQNEGQNCYILHQVFKLLAYSAHDSVQNKSMWFCIDVISGFSH
jgi:hypothetical protein